MVGISFDTPNSKWVFHLVVTYFLWEDYSTHYEHGTLSSERSAWDFSVAGGIELITKSHCNNLLIYALW